MGRADDRAQVVGVLDSVQHDVQPAACRGLLQRSILLSCAKSDDALMRSAIGCAVELLASLEAHRNPALFAKRDQFLQPWPSCPLGHQHPVQRAAGAQRFTDGMDSSKREHYDKVTP